MKTYKILYISIFAFLALILVSCDSDLLNPLPKDRMSAELFWKTEREAIYAANGIYSVLGGSFRYVMMDAYADIGHVVLQYRDESMVQKHTHNSSSTTVANEWRYYYNIIQSANTFLEQVDMVDVVDEGLINRLKAEARTLRAFAYINLVMLYGDVPLLTKNPTLSEARAVSRTPVNDVWDFISTELSEAALILPPTQTDIGRVTRGAAHGLRARAMLYAGRYAEARTAALAVMSLGIHQIHDSYAELFDYAGQGVSEVIFARQYARGVSTHDVFNTLTANSLYSARCLLVPTKSLVDAYLSKSTGLPIDDPTNTAFDPFNPYSDRDPRLAHTVFVSGDVLANGEILNTMPKSGSADAIDDLSENSTPTGWYFKKWVSNDDFASPGTCALNLIYLRYAEVLLTYAEASIELGGTNIDQSVLDALNQLRTRSDVDMPPVTTMNQTELREIVRRERLVELALEGHRLFDIRRWRIAENVIPGTLKGMTYEDPDNPGTLEMAELSGFVK